MAKKLIFGWFWPPSGQSTPSFAAVPIAIAGDEIDKLLWATLKRVIRVGKIHVWWRWDQQHVSNAEWTHLSDWRENIESLLNCPWFFVMFSSDGISDKWTVISDYTKGKYSGRIRTPGGGNKLGLSKIQEEISPFHTKIFSGWGNFYLCRAIWDHFR